MFDWVLNAPLTLNHIFLQYIALGATVREKCPYSEFFWSECGKIRIRKTKNTDTLHPVLVGKYMFIQRRS